MLRLPATDTSPEMIIAGNHLMPATMSGQGQVARALVVFADNLDGYVDDLAPVWRTGAEEVVDGLRVRRTTTRSSPTGPTRSPSWRPPLPFTPPPSGSSATRAGAAAG